ncbi:HAD family hydrolase [Patescibacteria group bacterium]|nr:HAD family hydrolase [Patescibacteria group bacterium]
MNKSKYKAVIFDFDDTLVASREIKFAHHKHVAKNFYKIDLTDEDIRKHWGKPLHKLVGELYQNADTIDNMYSALISTRENFLKTEYPGASEAVVQLLDKGIEVGILTATSKNFLVEDLKRMSFPHERMLEIQGAEETEYHKPDPKVFIPILEKFTRHNIKHNEIVYVGDSVDDFHASLGAGIDFIAITTGLYDKEFFHNLGVKNIITNISEVIDKVI